MKAPKRAPKLEWRTEVRSGSKTIHTAMANGVPIATISEYTLPSLFSVRQCVVEKGIITGQGETIENCRCLIKRAKSIVEKSFRAFYKEFAPVFQISKGKL